MEEVSEELLVSELPEKSKKAYWSVYESFNIWKAKNNTTTSTEADVLNYFTELSTSHKPSSLWSHYSRLKHTLLVEEKVNIKKFPRLLLFLRNNSKGFQAKQSLSFTGENMKDFLSKAPDDKYLPTKVAMIFGVFGACQSTELATLKIGNLQDMGTSFVVTILNPRTKQHRNFVISYPFYEICKKYFGCRLHDPDALIFQPYSDGKVMNITTLFKMGKEVAKFLKLDNIAHYSGHSFKLSSANIILDADGNIISKRPELLRDRIKPTTSVADTEEANECDQSEESDSDDDTNIDFEKIAKLPAMTFNNCHNVKINVKLPDRETIPL